MLLQNLPHRLSDFDKNSNWLEGEKIKINNVLGKEIVILKFQERKSKFEDRRNPNFMVIQFFFSDDAEQKKWVVTNSGVVVMSKLREFKEKLPFVAKIYKENGYYTIR